MYLYHEFNMPFPPQTSTYNNGGNAYINISKENFQRRGSRFQ